jgi:hypothetical protein
MGKYLLCSDLTRPLTWRFSHVKSRNGVSVELIVTYNSLDTVTRLTLVYNIYI